MEKIKSASNILIVDDSEENIFSLTKILEKFNYRAHNARSGEEALKKALKNNYSLILLDVQMPVMNGFEVAEALKGAKKTMHIPLIFLTAMNKSQNLMEFSESGPVDYLVKPFDIDLLAIKINNFLRFDFQKRELEKARKEIFDLRQKALADSLIPVVK